MILCARALLALVTAAVTGMGLTAALQWGPFGRAPELELVQLDLSTRLPGELAGSYTGQVSHLKLLESGHFEYRGDLEEANDYGCLNFIVQAEGRWRIAGANLQLTPEDESRAVSLLAAWDSSEGLRLTPVSGGFLVADTLQLAVPAKPWDDPSLPLPPGVVPR